MSVAELMCGALAREISDRDCIGVGLGTPLALVAVLAAKRSTAPGMEFCTAGALSPEATLAGVMRAPEGLRSATGAWVSHLDSMDMAERRDFTLMFLRPAQVDQAGRLNVSRAGGRLLPGGVGSADTPTLLERVIAYHPDHRPRSLPGTVEFATSRAPVATLVTDRCVIDFAGGHARARSIHPGETPGSVREATGYDLDGLEAAPFTPPPSPELLAAIFAVDPDRVRDRELSRAPRGAAH